MSSMQLPKPLVVSLCVVSIILSCLMVRGGGGDGLIIDTCRGNILGEETSIVPLTTYCIQNTLTS